MTNNNGDLEDRTVDKELTFEQIVKLNEAELKKYETGEYSSDGSRNPHYSAPTGGIYSDKSAPKRRQSTFNVIKRNGFNKGKA